MKYDDETGLLCSEFSQQDWSDLRFKKVYQDGFRDAREHDKEIIQSLEAELESLKKAYGLAMTENAELRREVELLKQVITAQSSEV